MLNIVVSVTAVSVRAQIRFECSKAVMDVEYHPMQFSSGSRRNSVAYKYIVAVSSRQNRSEHESCGAVGTSWDEGFFLLP